MCFTISNARKPWKVRTVWKIVDSALRPAFKRTSHHKPLFYLPGKTVAILKSAKTDCLGLAQAGLYVYRSRARAIQEQERCLLECRAIVELRVDPKDFLYQDLTGSIGTYRRARVVRVLPR